MGMIDRYRKKGGFVQLLNLIETTGKDKQEKFLKMIADESPIWETEVRKKVLTLDKVLGWNSTYLAEIFPRVQSLQLAMIVGGLPTDKGEILLKAMAFKERRQVEEILQNKKPTPAEVSSGIMKLFAEIRKMEAEGSLKFEKFDQDMVVEEDIEEKLGKGFSVVMTPKEIEQAAAASSTPVPQAIMEELAGLRRKLVQLTQENHKLKQENLEMLTKLNQIRKIS